MRMENMWMEEGNRKVNMGMEEGEADHSGTHSSTSAKL